MLTEDILQKAIKRVTEAFIQSHPILTALLGESKLSEALSDYAMKLLKYLTSDDFPVLVRSEMISIIDRR